MNKRSGITLIALIITIIVLLILAGVTIALVVGDNGILSKSTEAKKQTVVVQEKEYINLAYSASFTKNEGSMVTAEDLQEELDNLVGNGKTVVTENDDDTLNILFNDTGHNYTTDGHKTEEVELLELHITNYNELLDFANRVNAGESFARYIVYLDNDITMEDDDWVMIGTQRSRDFEPMAFEGIFEGNNHTIRGVTISSKKDMGLFCFNKGTIRNLKAEVTISKEERGSAGGICAENNGSILNCSVVADINMYISDMNFDSGIGGVCGLNHGLIDGCKTSGNIEGYASRGKIGGIAGYNNEIINNCKNEATIIAKSEDSIGVLGGISGENLGGRISKCINLEELTVRRIL